MRIKNFLLLFTLLFVWGSNLCAENVISVNQVSIRPGGTAELVVSLESDADFNVYAYDFRLYLPNGIEVATKANGSYVYELKERNADHSSNVQVTSDGSIQFGVNSPTLALTGNTGEVLGITLKASESLPEGNYTASITAITYANKEAQTVHPADITFNIEVNNLVVLDENSTTVPEEATGVNVRVLRTIKANEWSTICLPFAMTAAQVTAAFGDDVQLADFTGYETEENDDGDIVGITVNFNDITAIEANHPCIIKVTTAVTEFTVGGVDIDPEDEPTVATVKRTKKQWSELIGTYVANTVVPDQTLFLSGNNFWYSTGLTKMKAFRAYFDFYDVLTEVENGSANVKMFVDNDDASGVVSPIGETEEGAAIYNLAGQRVGKNYRGIVIENGKKIKK